MIEISDSLLAYYFMQTNTPPPDTNTDPVQAALCTVEHGLNNPEPCESAPSVHQPPTIVDDNPIELTEVEKDIEKLS